MKTSLMKTTALAAMVAIGSLALTAPAEAGRRHYGGHHHHRGGGNAVAAGIIGLAIGAMIAGSIAQSDRRAYAPAPVYGGYGPPAPWTPEWYEYCSYKYQSFDPRSGTYQPLYGPRQLCQ